MVAVHDIGRAINPTTAEGQVEGALQQGIGFALMEDLLVDDATGRTRNANFVDYKILTALDMPEIQVELLESEDELGPFGAKGRSGRWHVPDGRGDRECDLSRHRGSREGTADHCGTTACGAYEISRNPCLKLRRLRPLHAQALRGLSDSFGGLKPPIPPPATLEVNS